MGIHRMGPPIDLILALQQRLGIHDFVETGTYSGDTAEWAAKHFARVATIELSPDFHAAAVKRFGAQPRVRALMGNSAAVLREVVPGLAGPTIFWLDAHWSGLNTAGREAECPLLEELAIVNAAPLTHTVLVDDARLFCAPPPRPHLAEQWPDLANTVAALSGGDRRYVALIDDVLIAVPSADRRFVRDWLQDATTAAWALTGRKSWWQKLGA
jgi:hypothetical protein